MKSTILVVFLVCIENVFSFTCPAPSGSYPDPTDCSKFYTCNNGQATQMSCGAGTVFNPQSQVCDWPSNVNCGGSQTTTPSTTTTTTNSITTTTTTKPNTNPGYVEEGICSWYGAEGEIPEGWPTACGVGFSRYAIAAAHKTLPCGTMVKVTNTNNNQFMVVKIDDRGPYAPGRILDLTYAAAQQFGIIDQGLMPCRIETV